MKNKKNSPFLERNIHKSTDISASLKRIGLSNNEMGIYNYLLENGRSKSGPIIRQTGIASSAFYESISSLTEKGFVSYEVINNIKFYNPETPERQINQLQSDIKDLQKISSILNLITTEQRDRNLINVYEGDYGFRRAFEQFVSRLKKKDVITIIGYNMDYKYQYDVRNFFIELDTQTKKRGATAKLLLQKELINTFRKERGDVGLNIYDIKTLPSGYFGPWAIDTSPYEVLLSLITTKPIAISIKHPIIVDSFRKNFDYLWQSAKKA